MLDFIVSQHIHFHKVFETFDIDTCLLSGTQRQFDISLYPTYSME